MSIDHVAYYAPTAAFDEEVAFLCACLKHMDMVELMRPKEGVVGLGSKKDCKPFLWVAGVGGGSEGAGASAGGDGGAATVEKPEFSKQIHLALAAGDRAQVDLFHQEALKAGGKCNGPPGIRAYYHPGYYAAFVWSPAGANIEVVYHGRPTETGAAGGQ